MKLDSSCYLDNCIGTMCTGCMACKIICPNMCIEIITDENGFYCKPFIDKEKCVGCNLCINTCPILNNQPYQKSNKTFAALSVNKEIYNNAASGGIASELYSYAIENEFFAMGTYFDREVGVNYREIKCINDIVWARDSKYVFSDATLIYKKYEIALKSKKNCIFIGLPCQVAGLKSYLSLKNIDQKKLITVDLICHGTPSWKYLDEHLAFIEKTKHKRIYNIRFRDPLYFFYFRAFTNQGKEIYHAGMHEDDTYYRAFSLNLSFREGCYNCIFAKSDRISDITIGDFSGLVRDDPVLMDARKISVVLTNTSSGEKLISFLKDKGTLLFFERTYEEAYNAEGNPNLRHPSIPHENRKLFMDIYIKNKNFEYAVKCALRNEFLEWEKCKTRVLLKRWILSKIPMQIKNNLKKFMHFFRN